MAIINDNIRFVRIKNGLSQQKLADKLGVNRGNIDSYERTTKPKPEVLASFANAFGIDLQMLIAQPMNDYNYSEFMAGNSRGISLAEDPVIDYEKSGYRKSVFFQLMQKVKAEQDYNDRSRLVDEAMALVSQLEDENRELVEELRSLVRDLRKHNK